MTEWVLDMRPRLEPWMLQQLEQVLHGMGPDDRLTLIFEREDAHQTGPVVRLLSRHGLGWQPRGGHARLYFLHAGRHLTRPHGLSQP